MTRNNINYYRMDDTSTPNRYVLEGCKFYNMNGKQTGTMPNNGALSYVPSDDAQIIPEGYTTGGTIVAANITSLSEYQTCLNITEEILGDVSEATIRRAIKIIERGV